MYKVSPVLEHKTHFNVKRGLILEHKTHFYVKRCLVFT